MLAAWGRSSRSERRGRIGRADGGQDGDEPVVLVEGLVKRYGQGVHAFPAVQDISFAVQPGEVFGFLGPNGAGKTTTISVLCTLLKPTAGAVRVAGYDVAREPDAVRRAIGLIFQDPTLDDQLTAQENLDFHAFAYDVPAAEARARGAAAAEAARAVGAARRPGQDLLGRDEAAAGDRPRAAAPPRVLFLDEPTQGLDPQTRALIWRSCWGCGPDGMTLFMTTHYMDEAEYCDRIAIIDHGRIVGAGHAGPAEGVRGRRRGDARPSTTRGRGRRCASVGAWRRRGRGGAAAGGGARGPVRAGAGARLRPRVRSISVRRPTLDDVFLKLTGRVIREQEASEVELLRQRGRMWGRR